jgi:hypothetical protein
MIDLAMLRYLCEPPPKNTIFTVFRSFYFSSLIFFRSGKPYIHELIAKVPKKRFSGISHFGVHTLVCLGIQSVTHAKACTPNFAISLKEAILKLPHSYLDFGLGAE